jgi:ribonuclease P protein component
MSVPRSVGNAVARNKLKRQLRELWQDRLDRVPEGRDYVLIVRPGVAEATAANGFGWLGERIDEVLDMTKAAA